MGRGSNPEKVAEWTCRFERFERSSVSVAAFCQHENVSVQSFYQWRKKLRDRADHGSFRQVQVVASPTLNGPAPTIIQLGSGVRIELGGDLPVVELVVKQLLATTIANHQTGGETC